MKRILALACALLLCLPGFSKKKPDYRVCAYVWPSCHDDSLAHRWLWADGEGEWEIRGKEKTVIDENGNTQRETDKDRKIAYWKAQHDRKKTKV